MAYVLIYGRGGLTYKTDSIEKMKQKLEDEKIEDLTQVRLSKVEYLGKGRDMRRIEERIYKLEELC